MTTIDRRAFLKRGAAVTAGTLLASTATQALAAHGALAAPGRRGQDLAAPDNGGYGPIAAAKDMTTGLALLALPAGFQYASFGHGTDFDLGGVQPYVGSDGYVTPGRHDGMGTFVTSTPGVIRLVRNHEQGYEPVATSGRDTTGLCRGMRPRPTTHGVAGWHDDPDVRHAQPSLCWTASSP